MRVRWTQVAPYIERTYETSGCVERAAVNAACDDGASDAVVDALDVMGSRVFATPEEAREFLEAQKAIEN